VNLRTKHKILVVDDEKPICEVLSAALLDEGYEVEVAHNGEKGLKAIETYSPDVVLLDIWMPGKLDGIDVLQAAKVKFPNTEFIIMSGHGTIETAVKAVKLGAWDFVEKPLSSDRIFILIKNILNYQQERNEKRALLNKLRRNFAIFGHSQPIQELKKNIARVAQTEDACLIEGQMGVGKTLVAQNIHYLSERASQPFVEINCKHVPQDLVDMQIFGFDKKPLIGVDETQKGKLDLVQGGTLFLKEISYLNKDSLTKIAKLIETKQFQRVGSQQTLQCDIRVVASTTQSLDSKVSSMFVGAPLVVPAIKDRKEDIPVLVQHFGDYYANESGTRVKMMSEDAIETLTQYTWPGNVRELKNFVERIYILVETDEVNSKDLAEAGLIMDSDQGAITASNLKIARSIFEKQYILKKLEENNGNVSKTAEMIGLERSHLHRKMKTYGIDKDEI
jgi:two-component system nitrogen regulation response regulator NtrX